MPEPLAETVISKLAVHLGPHVARMAVTSFVKKVGVAGHDQLTAAHVPQLMREIRPMLNVMIGKAPSESVIADIARLASGT